MEKNSVPILPSRKVYESSCCYCHPPVCLNYERGREEQEELTQSARRHWVELWKNMRLVECWSRQRNWNMSWRNWKTGKTHRIKSQQMCWKHCLQNVWNNWRGRCRWCAGTWIFRKTGCVRWRWWFRKWWEQRAWPSSGLLLDGVRCEKSWAALS